MNRIVAVSLLLCAFATSSNCGKKFHHYPLTSSVTLSISSPSDEYHKHSRSTHPKATVTPDSVLELQSDYWRNRAQDVLRAKINAAKSTDNVAKNVIFFIGDGMSVQTVTAARIHTGKDEKFEFAFDKMPSSGFAKTYCVDAQVADSACTATAYHTGVKTMMGHIGIDARAKSMNCTDHANTAYHLEAISQWAHDAGMSLGLITTSRVTDASPSPLFASASYRMFETDQELNAAGCDANKLDDIAEQLVHKDLGKNFRVILGGGRSVMLDKSIIDEEGVPGRRNDGKNLIKDWQNIHQSMGKSEYVWNRAGLMGVDTSNTDYLLGMFEGEIMKFNYQNTNQEEPSLSEMVKVAIEILSKNEKGYYLFVEGGLIDYGHHYTLARVALDETKCLGEALETAQKMTNSDDTLIVLSADHAHTMTINGYSVSGQNL